MPQRLSMVSPTEIHERFEANIYGSPDLSGGRIRQQDPQANLNHTLVSNPYSAQSQQRIDYRYQNQVSAATTPPSPPAEDGNRLSLPSISSLLGRTEGKGSDQAQQLQQEQQAHLLVPSPEYTSDALVNNYGQVMVGGRDILPPTPPLVPDSAVEGNQSPSTVSTQSTVSGPQAYFLGQSLGQSVAGMESHHRHTCSDPSAHRRLTVNTQTSMSQFHAPPYSAATYSPSPGNISSGSGPAYYPTDTPVLQSTPGLYGQRPLPSNFPPTLPIALPTPPAQNASNPWQHHHYINTSSQAAFPQTQDRYVCPTCSKAFSRPSSLRIHMHSHTGEKPFKCSHAGCGKAFSVRSNMKRHERGCHTGTNSAASVSS